MSNNMFNLYTTDHTLEWTCLKCGIPPIHNLLSDSLLSSSSETSVNDTPKAKARMLCLMVVNLQGLWGKKELFTVTLSERNPDIVIVSETFLDPSIKDSEIKLQGYIAYRNDRKDGWVGVAIFAKSSLITYQVYKSDDTECVAIKVETFKKPIIVCSAHQKVTLVT